MLRAVLIYLTRCPAALWIAPLLLFAAVAGGGEPAGKDWHHDWPTAWRDSQAQDRPILLFITMEHCHYCEKMSRETYADGGVVDELDSSFVRASIDSDRDPRLVRQLNVQAFPTTVILGPDAHVIDSMKGYVGPEQLRTRLRAASAKVARR